MGASGEFVELIELIEFFEFAQFVFQFLLLSILLLRAACCLVVF